MTEDDLGGRLELRDPAALEGAARRLYDELQEGPLRRGREFGYKAELPDGGAVRRFLFRGGGEPCRRRGQR